MDTQPELLPGTRIPLPDCYHDVCEAMDSARENGFEEIDSWEPDRLADDMIDCAGFKGRDDIIKSIKIYRERNQID